MNHFFLIAAASLGIYILALSLLAYFKKNSRIIALAPFGSVLIVAAVTLLTSHLYLTRPVLATALLVLWSAQRFFQWYYKSVPAVPVVQNEMPEKSAPSFMRSLLLALAVQLPLALALSIPAYLLNRMCAPGFHALDITGLSLAVFGLLLPLITLFPFVPVINRLDFLSDLLFWLGISVMALSVPYGSYAFIALLAIMLRPFLVTRSSFINSTQ